MTPGNPTPVTFSLEIGFGERGHEETILTVSRFGEFTIECQIAGLVSYRYQVWPVGAEIKVALDEQVAE